MYLKYKDRAEFLLVYIREAHPDSVLLTMRDGTEALEKIEQTDDVFARAEHAEVCMATLKLSVPTVIDGEDNVVNTSYAGWPDRMYIVTTGGRIAYQGAPGPSGFKPAEVEEWLEKNLGDGKGE